MTIKEIEKLLDGFQRITLEEMGEIRLMNRTDTKFVANTDQLGQFLAAAASNYYAQEIDGSRISPYHTVYLDTQDCAMYRAHHNGRLVRKKVRMRTYMSSGTTFFEIKNKNNHGRTKKKRFEIESMERVDEAQADELLQKHTPYRLSDLQPTVENNFSRITLVNRGKTERLTIDFELRFHHLKTDLRKEMGNFVVLELKRDGNVPSPALDLFRQCRIHRSGFSKYCIGSVYTNPSLKQNRFKPKITKFNKINNNQKL